MTGIRKSRMAVFWLIAGAACASAPLHAGELRGSQAPPPLTMEELEVRGSREKPDMLFLPPLKTLFHAAPAHLDLLAEDMARPILPWEIADDNMSTLNGGALGP